jgi:hypothetical protein
VRRGAGITCPSVVTLDTSVSEKGKRGSEKKNREKRVLTYSNMFNPAPTVYYLVRSCFFIALVMRPFDILSPWYHGDSQSAMTKKE